MQLDLTEEQGVIQRAVRELCAREFAPHAARWDVEGDVPRSAVEKLGENGFLGMTVPEEWGGVGYDSRTITLLPTLVVRNSSVRATSG